MQKLRHESSLRGGGSGLATRLEAGTLEVADTKLRVAEEHKCGETWAKGGPAGSLGIASLGGRERRDSGWPPKRVQTAWNYLSGSVNRAWAPAATQRGRCTGPKRQAKPAADEGFWDCSVCTFRNSAEAFKCSICDVRKGTSTSHSHWSGRRFFPPFSPTGYILLFFGLFLSVWNRQTTAHNLYLKPRINSQLVAQQVAQQYATPPPPKKEKKEKVEKQDKEKPEKDKEISPSVTKKNTNKKTKPKSDILKDPPSEANSIQSANATTKTSETNHTSRPRLKNVDRSTAQQLAVTVGNVTVIITDFKEKTRSSSTSSSTVTSSAGSEQQNQSSSGSESTDKGSSRSSTPKGDMSAVNDESF
ncbi:RING1 and YY1-binding protein [Fukomys damarensis]|uniref:RING1 and YY1-binding protein n=1 Tax=Fukomys damarensis TaxID=885580 RepID=UPI00053FA2E5|nr:RING1 and YY1-binding protein [Fukomys damarensis]